MYFDINKSRGLAQIPLMIVLLLIAIAVPVATKLVQQNQENRSDAKIIEQIDEDIVQYRTKDDKTIYTENKKTGEIVKKQIVKNDKDPNDEAAITKFKDQNIKAKEAAAAKATKNEKATIAAKAKATGTKASSLGNKYYCSTNLSSGVECGWFEAGLYPVGWVENSAPKTVESCTNIINQTECGYIPGCRVQSGKCTKSASLECSNISNQTECGYIPGCRVQSGKCTAYSYVTKAPTTKPTAKAPYCLDVLYSDCINGCQPTTSGGVCKTGLTGAGTIKPPAGGTPKGTAVPVKKPGGSSGGSTTSGGSCVEMCPNPKDKTLLYTCNPPEKDGTADIKGCGWKTSMCGGSCYTCATGGTWKKAALSKCPTPTPAVKCAWCGSNCAKPNPLADCGPGLPPANKSCVAQNGKCVAVNKTSPILNYKISFGGVVATNAQCAVGWPIQIIVLAAGESKVYTDVPVGVAVGGKMVYSGSITLAGFTKTSGIAVFIKGPKHLQMKYGQNNQTSVYNKAGGTITLTTVASTSPVYDFSGYPLMPGDVVSLNNETQDGFINGLDYSFVKSKVSLFENVAFGKYLLSDLDGNCQANSNDINLLKISLQDKQGQLY